jgi:Spy/CpxP family protein refolding chaperone
MKKILVAVVMVAVLAAAGLVMAQDSGKSPAMERGYGFHGRGDRSAGPVPWDRLNLTPDQVDKLKALRKSFLEEKIPLQNDLMRERLEMKALWMQANPDEQKILAKQQEINSLRAQIGEKAIKNRLEMRKILTPEQQAMWIQLLGRHQAWRGHDRWCGFGRGPGQHHPNAWRGHDRWRGFGRGPGDRHPNAWGNHNEWRDFNHGPGYDYPESFND